GARWPRSLAGAGDGHRGGALSPAGRRAARRTTSGAGTHHERRGGMTRARSGAYWAANRYSDEAIPPAPTAPLKDLPTPAAARFRALRKGLGGLDGVAEVVRYMGASGRWAWEYGVGNGKLCWLHVGGDTLSTTFTMSDGEKDRLGRAGRVPAEIRR